MYSWTNDPCGGLKGRIRERANTVKGKIGTDKISVEPRLKTSSVIGAYVRNYCATSSQPIHIKKYYLYWPINSVPFRDIDDSNKVDFTVLKRVTYVFVTV